MGIQLDDCDDENPAVNPSADEYCDDTDNNCDGLIDNSPVEGIPYRIWMVMDTATRFGAHRLFFALWVQQLSMIVMTKSRSVFLTIQKS